MKNFFFPALLLLISSCATLPKNYQTKDEVISTGPGPEDMVIDTSTETARILISCNERREGKPDYGEINAYYPQTGKIEVLQRKNEPAGFQFQPHGIDLVQVKDSLILLVVNHEHSIKVNAIVRYQLKGNDLYFLQKITDPLISSPNAVTGFSDGTLLVSNDAKKAGNIWEPLFKLKKAEIVFWNGTSCSVASDKKYCYSNGITNRNGKVYLTSTLQNKVWQFDFKDGQLLNREVIAKVKGADNLRFDGNNILVACHLRFLDFLKHMKDPNHYSPTTVYSINPSTKKAEVVYFDNGAQLSGGATGLSYNGYLYAGGVFDAKIVRKKR
jgi:outer membrane protein assembly factor BamB